jgi:hypothetical protein
VGVACADCRFFASAYPEDQEDVRLRGWGYCSRSGGGEQPRAATMVGLRAAVLNGDRHALRRNWVGLYRSEPEDGCEYFVSVALARGAGAGRH